MEAQMTMLDKELIRKRVVEFQEKEIPDEEIFVDTEANNIVKNCLPEFEQNVMEWCNHEPLTEIEFVKDWSVKRLYETFPKSCFSYILWVAKHCKERNSDNIVRWFTTDLVI